MPRYYKREIADLNNTGKKQYRYEFHTVGNIDIEQLAVYMHRKMHLLSEGDFVAIAREMADTIAHRLAEGYSVSLGDMGSFSVSLGLIDYDKDTPEVRRGGEPNARRVGVKGVNFKANPKFVKRINTLCSGKLKRDRGGTRTLCQPTVPRAERIQRVLQFIRTHGMLRVMDYVELSGLSRTSASLELRQFYKDPEVPITATGRGSHRVYVEKK